jgi:hypothetical protein
MQFGKLLHVVAAAALAGVSSIATGRAFHMAPSALRLAAPDVGFVRASGRPTGVAMQTRTGAGGRGAHRAWKHRRAAGRA